MHKKPGFVLFLVFSVLSLCTTLITLYFARSTSYQHLMLILNNKEKANQLLTSSIDLGKAVLASAMEQKQESDETKDQKKSPEDTEKQFLENIFPYLHSCPTYKIHQGLEGMDAKLQLCLGSEYGKLNINSVYSLEEKKFVNEGQAGDRKKFCQWLFNRISKITQKPSLFDAFENHLKNRSFDFNDVTELLHIKEFFEVFEKDIFLPSDNSKTNKIYLTDIFTIDTEQDTINPWFFTHSWRIIIGFDEVIDLPKEEGKKVIATFKMQANWEKDWHENLKLLYQKDYADLPEEIKSMLTTDFEANIFSLLLHAIIGETTSTIFTILKTNKKNKPVTFDIVRLYQL